MNSEKSERKEGASEEPIFSIWNSRLLWMSRISRVLWISRAIYASAARPRLHVGCR